MDLSKKQQLLHFCFTLNHFRFLLGRAGYWFTRRKSFGKVVPLARQLHLRATR